MINLNNPLSSFGNAFSEGVSSLGSNIADLFDSPEYEKDLEEAKYRAGYLGEKFDKEAFDKAYYKKAIDTGKDKIVSYGAKNRPQEKTREFRIKAPRNQSGASNFRRRVTEESSGYSQPQRMLTVAQLNDALTKTMSMNKINVFDTIFGKGLI